MNILFLLILCALKRDMSGMTVNITALVKPTVSPAETILISEKHLINLLKLKSNEFLMHQLLKRIKCFYYNSFGYFHICQLSGRF